ncbi:MAG: diguanylate cyclase domain-containing protein [Roseovarius sp.]
MPCTVLIVEGLATNRIVLKVKLSAAYFSVRLAGSAEEASIQVSQDRPQAVLISDDLPDATARDLVRAIRALQGCDRLPVLVLADTDSPAQRLTLLRAGANDVIPRAFSEDLLLARLRSLSRQAPADADLDLAAGTAAALGFAEAQAGFTARGVVAAWSSGTAQDRVLFRRLEKHCRHQIEQVARDPAGALAGTATQPDVLIVSLPPNATETDLVRMAELGSAPQTRQARLLALVDPTDPGLAAKALDMGVHDIASRCADPREIALRLDMLLQAKQADDTQKARLRTGLRAAVTDPLTGLYNRRYALAQMTLMIDAARETQQPFAVMVADLDHFKTVNDSYGHAAGDEVLVRIAQAMRNALGPVDTLARIGGEEFLVLMPQSDARAARSMARHLCRTVRETMIALPGRDTPVADGQHRRHRCQSRASALQPDARGPDRRGG